MPELNQKIVSTDRTGLAQDGTTVNEQTKSIQTDANPKNTVANAVWYVFGFIAILLAIRFVLKLAGANPNSGFVDFIYSASGILSAPFDNIFGVAKATTGNTTSVFEPSILVAIAVYALIAWGIVKLIRLNEAKA